MQYEEPNDEEMILCDRQTQVVNTLVLEPVAPVHLIVSDVFVLLAVSEVW